MENKNDKIIRRVKRLLALAEDEGNIHESQSAFLRAQEMMIKYGIDSSEVKVHDELKDILTKSATDYKKLWWWERSLANVIANNFRCSWYYNSKHIEGKKQKQRKIVFVGYENDILLATEMYVLAKSATDFYADRYLRQHNIKGNRGSTVRAKDDYIRGFITGLEEKFEEQIKEQEWGLMVLVPTEVIDKTDEITKNGKKLNWTIPKLDSHEHYQIGYKDGNSIDYTKSTIGEKIIK